jgi:transposase
VVEVSADKAYSTVANLAAVEAIGATPFVPFKSNSKPVQKKAYRSTAMWSRLWHYFQMNKEEFCKHYHRRSNVEATFSMMKWVIGDTLRSKDPVGQRNEALLMVLVHNLRCLIHEMVELGVAPMLEGPTL